MRPSKTQVQRKQEREEANARRAAEREAEKAARAAAARASISSPNNSSSSPSSSPAVKAPAVTFDPSTLLPDLAPFLIKMQKTAFVRDIHPGPIVDAATSTEELVVRYVTNVNGQCKYEMQNGSRTQDIFFTTPKIVKQPMLQTEIDRALESMHEPKDSASHAASSSSSLATEVTNPNKLHHAAQLDQWKSEQAARHAEMKEKEKAAARAKKEAEYAKTLKTKLGQRNEQIEAYAKAAIDWKEGKRKG